MQRLKNLLLWCATAALSAAVIWPVGQMLIGDVEARDATAQEKGQRRRPDYDVAEMYKMHLNRINGQFTTGAQPPLEELARLKAAGFTTIINLRVPGEHDAEAEEKEAERLGLRYFTIPVVYMEPKFEQVDEFLRLTDDPANRPALIHCTMNVRVGAFFAIRRVLRDGWKFEDAEKEAAKGAPIPPHLKRFALEYIAARQPK